MLAADTLLILGDTDDALAADKQSQEIMLSLVKAEPSNTFWQRELAVSDNKIGDVLRDQGDRDGARATASRSSRPWRRRTRAMCNGRPISS